MRERGLGRFACAAGVAPGRGRRVEAASKIRRAGKVVREDFMRLAWINQVLLAGARELLACPTSLPYGRVPDPACEKDP